MKQLDVSRHERRGGAVRFLCLHQAKQSGAFRLRQAEEHIEVRSVLLFAKRGGNRLKAIHAKGAEHLPDVYPQLGAVRRVVDQLRQHGTEVGPDVGVRPLQHRDVVRRKNPVRCQRAFPLAVVPREDTLEQAGIRASEKQSLVAPDMQHRTLTGTDQRGELDFPDRGAAGFAAGLFPVPLQPGDHTAQRERLFAGIHQE